MTHASRMKTRRVQRELRRMAGSREWDGNRGKCTAGKWSQPNVVSCSGTCRGRTPSSVPRAKASVREDGFAGEDKQIPRLRLRNDDSFSFGMTILRGCGYIRTREKLLGRSLGAFDDQGTPYSFPGFAGMLACISAH